MTPSSNKLRGFSLMELLCSMAILAIVMLTAAAMLGSSWDGYAQLGGSVATAREARAMMSQLTADLATARFHKDGILETPATFWAADRLGFIRYQSPLAQSSDGSVGDLCAVHYYIKDLSISGRIVRCLMRGCRESADTFKALEGDGLAALFGVREHLDEPVAYGVVAFEARPKARGSSGQWIDWLKNDITGPEVLDVRLVLARQSLVAKLKSSADWDGAGNAGNLLGQPASAHCNANLEVYATIIQFGSHENP